MSRFRRTARAARRRIQGVRERLSGEDLLVGLVRPEPWTTANQLRDLRESLRRVSPTALLLTEGEATDPEHLLLRLEPDVRLDEAALAEALGVARRSGRPVVAGGGDPLGALDPRDVLASWSAWSAVGTTPHAASAVDVLRLLDGDHVSVARWWSPGTGDGSLPLAQQRRFRTDLAEARTDGLLAALARLREERPADVDAWRTWMLGNPLPEWYADAVGGGPAYARAVGRLVRALLDGLDAPASARVPVGPRRTAYAAAHGTLLDLALLLDHDGDHPTGLPVEGDLVALPDGLSEPVAGMPPAWRRIEPVDRVGHARLLHAWDDGGQARLRGAAWTDYGPGGDVEVELLTTGTWHAAQVTTWRDDQVALAVDRAHEDHDAGFEVSAPGRPDAVRVRQGGTVHELVPVWTPGPPRGAPRVTGAELRDGALRLTLDGPAAASRLVGPRARGDVGEAEGTTLVFPLTAVAFGEHGTLPAGRYRLEGSDVGASGPLLADQPDLRDGATGVVLDVGPAGRLQVQVGTALTTWERSARGQQVLRDRVSRPTRTVLLEAFHGRSGGDNPGPVARALHELDPGLDLAFVVDDPRVRLPPGSRAVVRRSAQWHDLLSSAAAHVGNAAAPSWWSKPDHQVHLQTWHGTPLKRIGEDRGPGDLAVWRHRRDVASQSARWDGLVSANPLSSTAFRTAFGYDGPMLETGYPRNDVLVDPGRRDAEARRVRAALGILPGQRVVLYAPTWREYAGVRDAKPLHLEAPAVTSALGDTVVLVRGHYNATGSPDAFVGADRVVDVTRYPDMAPLLCAADALVTDYSSAMFDFALADRPIVLLVPDLEQYRDVERGFYLDLEAHAPGELVRTTAEVVDVLRGADTRAAERAAFRQEFCPWDDGQAAPRLARWLLERIS